MIRKRNRKSRTINTIEAVRSKNTRFSEAIRGAEVKVEDHVSSMSNLMKANNNK